MNQQPAPHPFSILCGCILLAAPGVAPALAGGPPLKDPIPGPIPTGDIQIQLEPIATDITAPNWGTHVPGIQKVLHVVDQPGIVWGIRLNDFSRFVFLDVQDLLVDLGIFGPDSFDERGLLGLAFHPDFIQNGLLYTYTSEPARAPADFSTIPKGFAADHQSVITEWKAFNPVVSDTTVDPASARVLLRIDQPQFNHNAGAMNFGPDGMLYIALGDGGGADDEDGGEIFGEPIIGHGPDGNGQNLTNPLGKILRIDPLGNNSANGAYGIPNDNPFVDGVGEGVVGEIFAYGFRNPFRFSFDRITGLLIVADVGQNDIEEIDFVVSGGNYGWRVKEGSFEFHPNGLDPGFVTVDEAPSDKFINPIAQYDHDEGIAIVGGFVYDGQLIPELKGRYIFGEFAQTFKSDGRLFYLDESNQILEFPIKGMKELGLSVLGFGQDGSGEVYLMANATGTPFGATGVVLQIVPARSSDLNADSLVNGVDLAMLLSQWTGTGQLEPCPPLTDGDLNVDCRVNGLDLARLLSEWKRK